MLRASSMRNSKRESTSLSVAVAVGASVKYKVRDSGCGGVEYEVGDSDDPEGAPEVIENVDSDVTIDTDSSKWDSAVVNDTVLVNGSSLSSNLRQSKR